MTALTAPAIRALRNRFGDLAGPIMALRDAGKTVRPFGDQFAVDEVVVDADELERMAARIADKCRAKRTKPKPAPVDWPDDLGNPSANHSKPRSPAHTPSDSIPTVEPVVAGERGTGPPSAVLCGCGRPKAGLHGKCWFMRGMAGPPGKRVYPKGRDHTSRITALEVEIAATKVELAAFKATVRAAVRELLERIDNMTSEGR